jgi:hypothetical protein
VKVNIADQLQQVGLFLAENGFIAVLKQTANTAVAAVVGDHIAG